MDALDKLDDVSCTRLDKERAEVIDEVKQAGTWRYVRNHKRRDAAMVHPDLWERALTALIEKESGQLDEEAAQLKEKTTPQAA